MRHSSSWLTSWRRVAAAAALAVAAVAAPSGQGAVTLGVPGRSSAHPSVAAAGRFVVAAWGATAAQDGTDVFAAVSRDAGATFGSPTRVSDAVTKASLSSEQPPQVALLPREGRDPSVLITWTARASEGTRLVFARSEDGGTSFGRPEPVPGSQAAGNRGWEATAIHPHGYPVAVWLDHRDLASAKSDAGTAAAETGEHQHASHAANETDGVARAQLSKLFFARLDRASSSTAITGGVCYCCKTTVAAGPDGAIYAAWRHVYPGNIRDIALTVSRDEGRSFAAPVRVSEDGWVLNGCPENGPALTVAETGLVHVVWPTLVPGATPGGEPTLGLFLSTSLDGSRFTPRQRIATEGVPRHPEIALINDGAIVVAWDEQIRDTRRVKAAIGRSDGQGGTRFTEATLGDRERAEHPAVAALEEGGFVAVWTDGAPTRSAVRVQRVPLR